MDRDLEMTLLEGEVEIPRLDLGSLVSLHSVAYENEVSDGEIWREKSGGTGKDNSQEEGSVREISEGEGKKKEEEGERSGRKDGKGRWKEQSVGERIWREKSGGTGKDNSKGEGSGREISVGEGKKREEEGERSGRKDGEGRWKEQSVREKIWREKSVGDGLRERGSGREISGGDGEGKKREEEGERSGRKDGEGRWKEQSVRERIWREKSVGDGLRERGSGTEISGGDGEGKEGERSGKKNREGRWKEQLVGERIWREKSVGDRLKERDRDKENEDKCYKKQQEERKQENESDIEDSTTDDDYRETSESYSSDTNDSDAPGQAEKQNRKHFNSAINTENQESSEEEIRNSTGNDGRNTSRDSRRRNSSRNSRRERGTVRRNFGGKLDNAGYMSTDSEDGDFDLIRTLRHYRTKKTPGCDSGCSCSSCVSESGMSFFSDEEGPPGGEATRYRRAALWFQSVKYMMSMFLYGLVIVFVMFTLFGTWVYYRTPEHVIRMDSKAATRILYWSSPMLVLSVIIVVVWQVTHWWLLKHGYAKGDQILDRHQVILQAKMYNLVYTVRGAVYAPTVPNPRGKRNPAKYEIVAYESEYDQDTYFNSDLEEDGRYRRSITPWREVTDPQKRERRNIYTRKAWFRDVPIVWWEMHRPTHDL